MSGILLAHRGPLLVRRNSLPAFVAVGAAGSLGTSPDGTAWTPQTAGFGTTDINNVAWSPTLGLFVAVGAAGSLGTSPDAVTWTPRTSGFGTTDINNVAWLDGLSKFIAVGRDGYFNTSADGVTWPAASRYGSSHLYDANWAPDLNLVHMVGASGTSVTSPNASTWTTRSTGAVGVLYTVRRGGSTPITVVGGGGSGSLYTSFTTTSGWSTRSDGISGAPQRYALEWSADAGLFVLGSSTGGLSISSNGTAWTVKNNGSGGGVSATIRRIAWSRTAGVFCAAGDAGTMQTSPPDGMTWTLQTSSFGSANIYGICGI